MTLVTALFTCFYCKTEKIIRNWERFQFDLSEQIVLNVSTKAMKDVNTGIVMVNIQQDT